MKISTQKEGRWEMWERKQKGDDSLKLKPNQILYCIALFTHGHKFGNKQIVLYNVKTRNEFFFPLKKVCTVRKPANQSVAKFHNASSEHSLPYEIAAYFSTNLLCNW